MQDMLVEHGKLVADRDRKERGYLAEELASLHMNLPRVKNELSNLLVKVDEDFDVKRVWKRMTREARVITIFMRSQGGGAQQSSENSRFWSALGDTTKTAKKFSSIFDQHFMPSSLQDDLLNYSKNSCYMPAKVNREL